ncbi:hypothetical protein E2C01_009286 [Portunus trituberculatus]|uniref:Uncharacterized protein n=1 Tax=Portunus trituberculatus TaxID=210409 RepID=A0A5B7D339_PORTR|nr:hypothetical protein [Portunus trituberculatus]
MATVVKEEPEAPYSLSLLLGDRNSRCRTMTASAMGPGAPPSPAVQHQTCGVQQQPPQQPIMNGVAAFERLVLHTIQLLSHWSIGETRSVGCVVERILGVALYRQERKREEGVRRSFYECSERRHTCNGVAEEEEEE